MAKKIPTNKLSVYLIKSDYFDHKDILKKYGTSLNSFEIKGIGTFYYGDSYNFKPSWLKKFFGTLLDENIKIFSASAKGLLLVEIVKDEMKRLFAIAFGYGWQFLRPGVYEERFGLKTALSVIDPNNLRKIGKKNMVTVPKDTSEQLSKAGIAADFGIDIEQDLICAITGKTINKEQFGKTISGKDSLSLSVKVNLSSLKNFLKLCYEKYLSDDYKKNFDWIDQIAEIKDIKLIKELDNKLIENLKNNNWDKTWMAVPEIVEWEHVSGFKYSHKKGEELNEDIDIFSFLTILSDDEKQNLNLDFLKRKTIYCIGAQNEEVKYQWRAYDCLYCEEQDSKKKKTYLLSNGKWYEIETGFAQQVNSDFQRIRTVGSTISLPFYKHKNENDYNEKVAQNDSKICCMDRKTVNHGGAYSKIEFCDLMTKDKKLIHVKHYGGSSVLSHLFLQGLVSGELFLGDPDFREKVNKKLAGSFKMPDTKMKPISSDYEIIYAIISSSPKELEVPFFSKVSLRNAKKRLETFGYKVSLLKIPTVSNQL
ncbi:MAG: TIGR04141 family sporadically distributed protein [Planctomycetota bacterium]